MKRERLFILLICCLVSMVLPMKALSAPGDIFTVAGGGVGDGSPATSAFLYHANDVALDGDGNLYIADTGNQRIRKVYAATGTIITVAGNGIRGYAGDNGPATAASLKDPSGVAVDSAGNLYIADCANNRIRKVTAGTGIITTVAGTGTPGYAGDSGPATAAMLNYARGVALDSAGNLYIADEMNQRIRKVAAGSGIITTIAGNGIPGYEGDNGAATAASLNVPVSMAVDGSGNLYIADFANNRIRKVAAGTGIITTIAGNGTQGYSGDGGAATAASLYSPQGVALDGAGNLYIVDEMNARIRKVAVATGIITTVAGNGTHGYAGDNGSATAASLNSPISIAMDSAGNFHIGDGGNNRIRKVSAVTGIITTMAGSGAAGYADGSGGGGGYSGDGGPATSGTLYQPHTLAVDNSGNLYIADSENHRIRKVAAGTGIITTVAGSGTEGYTGDGGPATAASINYPIGIAVDSSGNLYVADYYNQRIRKVAAGTGIITTVAGDGTQGYAGDNGPATSARLNYPWGVATDSAGNLFIADTGNQRIRKVTAGTGIITTVAGNGTWGFTYDNCPATETSLNNPESVTVDSAGNLYIADYDNQRIRKVTAETGIISTVAGNGTAGYAGDNDLATNAKLNGPCGVATDGDGNLYIADHFNERVRKVTAGSGIITTVAGSGLGGFSGDNGPATAARLSYPLGVALDGAGNLYIADFHNSRIREVIGSSRPVVIPSPDGGTFMYAPEVTLTASMPATIYYTTDGSDPATSATRQSIATSGTLALRETTTLKYYAVASGGNSIVETRVYTILKPSFSLSISIAGTGSGSVHSTPAGIACATGPTGTCTAPFDKGLQVVLTATPSAFSTFGGWSGDCVGSGSCSLTMSAARSATATFIAAPKVKVGTKGFSTLQAAYDDAGTTNGSVIRLLEGNLASTLTAGRGISVKLEGGYNARYDAISTETTIQGPLRIRSGTVRVKGVTVR